MHVLTIQAILVLLLVDPGWQEAVTKKRSPLEIGYVSFTQVPTNYKHSHANKSINPRKSGDTLHPRDVWVPGHVSHHAYIPAHHVIVNPGGLLVAGTVHTVLVRPHGHHDRFSIFDDDPYRRTYGGFGVGVGVGGHGAGHGYHVVFK